MKHKTVFSAIILLNLLVIYSAAHAQNKNPLTLQDVMKFKQIKEVKISNYGNWFTYTVKPDRGNSELIIASTKTKTNYKVERGSKPEISENEKWVSAVIDPDFMEYEKAEKDKPRNGLALLNTENGDTVKYKDVKAAGFSKNSGWIVVHFFEKKDTAKNAKPIKNIGSNLIIRSLTKNFADTISFVTTFAFDSLSNYISYVIADTAKKNNGLYLFDLKKQTSTAIDVSNNSAIENLAWHKMNKLAYTKSSFKKDGKKDSAEVKLWDNSKLLKVVDSGDLKSGWMVPLENKLNWSENGKTLFFGIKKVNSKIQQEKKDTSKTNPYNFESILAKKEVDVWHYTDPLIKSNEKKEWKEKEKFTYTTSFNFVKNEIIYLTDEDTPYLITNDNADYGLLSGGKDYMIQRTWDGTYLDYYAIDLNNGAKKLIVKKISGAPRLSPGGNFVTYYNDKNWMLYNTQSGSTINLTDKINVSFADEDHDSPSEPPAYGIGGWIADDKYLLVYDKYDIWKFDTKKGTADCLTDGLGRRNALTFRIQNTDKEKKYFDKDASLLLTAFNNKEKYTGFYSANVDKIGARQLLVENKKFSFIGKAKYEDKLIYTRETYSEYPDLWLTDFSFKGTERLTHLNDQLNEFAWGTSRLVEWNSLDGKELQGAVILPGNYEEGKKYPVLVYYYEISSQRVHDFNEMAVNHRPNFPFYASNGYIVFLPDVKFEVGRPGLSATKCVVPGVQKLIDMGLADPKGVALHGHSWGGYESAFIITQTDMFACAIAGAPVGNMTSAYSGIRWGTGVARQFQYEKQQSRIGGTLWEMPVRYIENSPVFFADRIHTPLLLMHGDEDDAVPWYQSIEIYLAMRRLGKDCIFLQYRGEPHHPQKYPNKLDYSIKMKEYIDHYCKNTPAPEWISTGVPYNGK